MATKGEQSRQRILEASRSIILESGIGKLSHGAIAEVLDISKDNLEALKEEAALVKPETLIRYIRVFSELSSQVKFASQKRIMVEIAIIKLCRPQMEKSYDSLLDRINSIEKKLEKGIPVAAQAAQTQDM